MIIYENMNKFIVLVDVDIYEHFQNYYNFVQFFEIYDKFVHWVYKRDFLIHDHSRFVVFEFFDLYDRDFDVFLISFSSMKIVILLRSFVKLSWIKIIFFFRFFLNANIYWELSKKLNKNASLFQFWQKLFAHCFVFYFQFS